MQAAIARHLNVTETAIIRIEEWANVVFCVVRGLGGRFISKKVTTVKNYEISLDDTGRKAPRFKKAWLAKLTGASAKYGFDRDFVAEERKSGRTRYFEISENGVYQGREFSGKGNEYNYFFEIKEGERIDLTEDEAKSRVGYAQPQKTQSLSTVSGKIVEECWECGATFTTYGNVEAGNMSCRCCG